jgi:RHS repeat-associated protein
MSIKMNHPRPPRLQHRSPRTLAWVASSAVLTLTVTLLNPLGPAQAASKPDTPPQAQQTPAVKGTAAPARKPRSEKVERTPSPHIELEAQRHTITLTTEAEAVGDTGVTVEPAEESAESGGDVVVEILGAEQRTELGVGLAIELTPSAGVDDLAVTVPSTLLSGLFGAGYATRTRWSVVPADAQQRSTQVDSVEAVADQDGVTASVPLAEPMLLMATSSTDNADGSGSYAATPLNPASTWDVAAQTGGFAWSYPIPAPPAPAGDTPAVSLEYNSQLVDGATASTNNQPSAIGEGWSLAGAGFIERRYVSCAREPEPANTVSQSGDLCWATDNATISFDGHSGTLIRDSSTGKWRLENDDNSRIEKLVGTGAGCASNGTYNTECWRVTTTDGTQYYFGLNRLPGWSSGNPVTNSAWTVPVFGNDTGDPCHDAAFADSHCQQGWRWNLDYVVDVHGNARAYYYAAETNQYRLNNTTPSTYTRGGQLLRIEYGLKASTVFAANAATSKVLFGYDASGRCNPANQSQCSPVTLGGEATTPATPSVYPDVPFDLNCTSGDCADNRTPSFWTTARLATITTQSRSGGTYKTADAFTLTHSFPDPGDGEDPALWLESVQRTATAGATSIAESATTFQRVALQNRVWVVDGLAPLDKFRVSSVTPPTGARISVNYSDHECTEAMAPAILESPWSNDKRCYPAWWTPDLDIAHPPTLSLFHKYVVTSMVEDPYTGGGGSPAIETTYHYTGKPGWRYNDDRLVPEDKRTWGDYAGYDQVEVRVGSPASPTTQSVTKYTFYRGMNGDRAGASGGAKSVNVTGTTIPDHRWFAGTVRSEKTLNGVGGATVSETVTTPWASAVNADNGTRKSRITGIERTDVIEPLSTGGTRTASTINTMDARGFVTQTSSEAGTGQPSKCATTQFAADNATAWIIGLPAVATEYAVACAQVPTAPMTSVLSHTKVEYDGADVGAAATLGLPTATWEARGFTGATLATADWAQVSATAYDAMGRVTSSTDAASRTTTTDYVPAATAAAGAGPLTSATVTNPLGWTTKTTTDPYRGLTTSVLDPNGKTATTEYDALGRLTKVWRTDWTKAAHPTEPKIAYEYGMFSDKPSYVKTTTAMISTYLVTYALFDGLGRPVQTQGPVTGGGAVISDTEYDAAGRTVATNDKYFAPTVTPGTTLFVPATVGQISTRVQTVYDGAGRATADVLWSLGAEVRRTTTTYRGADRIDVQPPGGGIPTSTYFDAWGQKTKQTQWLGAIDGTGVGTSSLRYQYNGRGQLTKMTDDKTNQWTWTFDTRARETSRVDPDAGTTTTTYDDLGNIVTSKDARNQVLAYTYDALDRKTTERLTSVTGTVLASWAYDTLAKGQLTSSSRFVGALEYKTSVKGYDDGYRPTGSTLSIPAGAPAFAGTNYSTDLYYNNDGSLAATALPAIGGLPAEELYPNYDGQGREIGLSGAVGYVSGVDYRASGEVAQISRPGTVASVLSFGYNPGTRELSSLKETTRRNGTVFTTEAFREYTRNAAGIITRVSTTSDAHAADVQCFSYDGLQALTDAWTPSAGNCATGPTAALGGPAVYRMKYATDAATGNRTSATSWQGTTATVTTYTYPAGGAARPHAVTQTSKKVGTAAAVATAYTHDARGGMTKRGTQTLTYDASGRVATVVTGTTTEQSLYDADGQLLMRWGGSDGASLFLGSTTVRITAGVTTGIRTYMVAGVTVAERVSGTGGGLWWLSPDPVGTVGLRINTTGTGVVTRRWMDPYGVARGTAVTWPSNLGYLNAPASATGLTQLGARQYDPTLGRFITVDPLLDTSEPRHANAYSYAYSSPISYADPTGLISNSKYMIDGERGYTYTGKTGTGKKSNGSDKPPPAGNKPATANGTTFAPPIAVLAATTAFAEAAAALAAAAAVAGGWALNITLVLSLSGDSSTARADAQARANDAAHSTPASPDPDDDDRDCIPLIGCQEKGDPDDPTSGWRTTNFADTTASIDYHYAKHGLLNGVSRAQYASDAVAWAGRQNIGNGVRVTLRDGSTGFRIREPGKPGGIIDDTGKVVTFWYK